MQWPQIVRKLDEEGIAIAKVHTLNQEVVFLGYRGSKAHGLHLTDHELGVDHIREEKAYDDTDLMAICMGEPEHYLGFGRAEGGQTVIRGDIDTVSYEFRKFIWLLMKSNPNVLTMLWLPDRHILYHSWPYKELRAHRSLFLNTSQAYHAFTGYAHGQLKRMVNWEATGRNLGAKRRALIEQHGYDVKNAAHLIRILKMGIEFLSQGKIYVDRHDAGDQI